MKSKRCYEHHKKCNKNYCEKEKPGSEFGKPLSAHTPGPWRYHIGRGENPRFHIQAAGGYQIASTTGLVPQAFAENYVREANARLIAAAPQYHEIAIHPNWERIWNLLNQFASGKTQGNWGRVEPLAVLSEVYLLLAQIDGKRKEAIAKAEGK